MNHLAGIVWSETRKARRSRLPLFTVLGACLMPLGIAFLILLATRPDLSQKLGLLSAKANLVEYAHAGWPEYLGLLALMVAAGGYFLCFFVIAWVFGREFVDGTLKDLLAVPVDRAFILLGKFIVAAGWSALLATGMVLVGLAAGAWIGLPQAPTAVIVQGTATLAGTAILVIAVSLPFAFFASVGRGYLLPFGMAVLLLILANLLTVLGWAPYFPWGVPGLYAQGKGELSPLSYVIVGLTGLAGMIATHLWWKYADHNR